MPAGTWGGASTASADSPLTELAEGPYLVRIANIEFNSDTETLATESRIPTASHLKVFCTLGTTRSSISCLCYCPMPIASRDLDRSVRERSPESHST